MSELMPTARLKYDVPVEIVAHSNFSSTDRTIQDQAWDDPDLEPWSLFLALDDDYSVSMGLPYSQRWPWDSHKGSYIPMGAHEVHCVVGQKTSRCFLPHYEQALLMSFFLPMLACSPYSS